MNASDNTAAAVVRVSVEVSPNNEPKLSDRADAPWPGEPTEINDVQPPLLISGEPSAHAAEPSPGATPASDVGPMPTKDPAKKKYSAARIEKPTTRQRRPTDIGRSVAYNDRMLRRLTASGYQSHFADQFRENVQQSKRLSLDVLKVRRELTAESQATLASFRALSTQFAQLRAGCMAYGIDTTQVISRGAVSADALASRRALVRASAWHSFTSALLEPFMQAPPELARMAHDFYVHVETFGAQVVDRHRQSTSLANLKVEVRESIARANRYRASLLDEMRAHDRVSETGWTNLVAEPTIRTTPISAEPPDDELGT